MPKTFYKFGIGTLTLLAVWVIGVAWKGYTREMVSMPLSWGYTGDSVSLQRATETLETIYQLYGAGQTPLLRENYPTDSSYRADYLVEGESGQANAYAYLWPYSGTLSALNALYGATGDEHFLSLLESRVLPGLELYYDDQRQPAAYASYIRSAGRSDRFYDDNIWLGIDFAELYLLTRRSDYLDKAKEVWAFVISGQDTLLGGGIYWCEQKKTSKNTCSNAPAAVFAVRMFEATKDTVYLEQAKQWYLWTKRTLQDPDDGLYWDNIRLDGTVDRRKFPYNSGQMLQCAVLLYELTRDEGYLTDAHRIAESGYAYFFEGDGTAGAVRRLKRSDNWFIAVMLRGYLELHRVTGQDSYLEAFRKSLETAWYDGRDASGLFGKDWSRMPRPGARKWLLDQAAMVEMYARLSLY